MNGAKIRVGREGPRPRGPRWPWFRSVWWIADAGAGVPPRRVADRNSNVAKPPYLSAIHY